MSDTVKVRLTNDGAVITANETVRSDNDALDRVPPIKAAYFTIGNKAYDGETRRELKPEEIEAYGVRFPPFD